MSGRYPADVDSWFTFNEDSVADEHEVGCPSCRAWWAWAYEHGEPVINADADDPSERHLKLGPSSGGSARLVAPRAADERPSGRLQVRIPDDLPPDAAEGLTHFRERRPLA